MALLGMLMLFFVINSAVSQASFPKVQTGEVLQEVINDIYFQLYAGPTVDDYHRIKYEDGLSLKQFKVFNPEATTVFHFPGWGENPNEHKDSVDMLASAFLTRNDINFIVIDYSKLVDASKMTNYLGAVFNASTIAKALGGYFEQYVRNVQPLEKLHLISHSLGSQILSRTTNEFRSGKFKWLTGLDPAGPIFAIPGVRHLSSEDGEFVDIIHTDSYMYGDGRTVGHVDFFPNQGRRDQPPCRGNNNYQFCSHHMSWRFYAFSVTNEKLYPAVKCERSFLCDLNMKNCKCDKKDVAFMGYDVDKKARGTYFLETSNIPPYLPIKC